MANKKRDVYKPKPMTEGKKAVIQGLLDEYDIQTADDIQEALKDLLSRTIQSMLEAEMNEHLGYEKYERDDEPNYRNGTKPKTVRSKYGEFEVDVPQDRNSTFEPTVVKKRQKDISGIEDQVIAMYAKGMTTTQISEMIESIYGFEISEGMVSDITDKMMPQIEDWQNRPLSAVYPIVFIDAIHFSVRNDGIVSKLAAYIVLGINEDGMKEVLSIEIGENESSKYWLSVLNSLKNRGVQDILILCSDGLTGLKEAIQAAFPSTEHQRCIVHMVRNTLKYVANKDMKAFAKDLKTLYTASDEKAALKRLDEVTKKWQPLYPHAMNRWHDNWDVITPIFKFSMDVRTAFYTTNAIESLNSCYRRLNKQRSVFPSSQALMKALYLATFEITKKWTMPIRNWGRVRGELSIMYPGRFSD
jgi:transposase-like protein